jgi:hypothetical protein
MLMTVIIQVIEGISAAAIIIAVFVGYFVLLYFHQKHRRRETELERARASFSFERAKTQALVAASHHQANVKTDGLALEIVYRFPPVAPHTYSPHIEIAGASALPQLASPKDQAFQQPDLRTIVSELPYNALAFAFGADRESGELLQTTLPKAVHVQLIGASGQGKSRQSTSILTQLCAGNDSEHLTLALIDCEGETTAPFQTQPHVRYLASEPEQAARVLHSLVKELERRDKVHVLMPALLIFVEEFLNLRRIMPANIKDQALEDYTTLALRGRKRGLFLFSVGQTAYVERAIRDAQNQFQSSMCFAGKPTMARSAGFTNTPLLNQLWTEKRPGQFLLERPAGDSLVVAPFVDSTLVPVLLNSQPVPDAFPTPSQPVPETGELNNGNEDGKQPELDMACLSLMREMVAREATQSEIIAACFPGMRTAVAAKEYRKYLAEIARK